MSTHLFIALSTKGFGETILGVQVAHALEQRGHDAVFLIHESSRKVLEAMPFDFMTIAEPAGPLLPVFVADMVDRHQPASIILSDFFTTDLWFAHHGVDREFLAKQGLPLIAIDTWSIATTGPEIDIYWRRTRHFEDWTHELDLLIQPAPLGWAGKGSNVYSCMPEAVETTTAVRARLRDRLELHPDDKIVLLCTAAWQQTRYTCPHAQRLSATLPQLLGRYLEPLESDVHLVHVGPQPYELPLGSRYHWLPQLEPGEFDAVLGGSDLLLTANISSTTIAKAMMAGIPVLAVINSFELATSDDLASVPFELDREAVAPWVAANLPLYRYYMWPVGYHAFLDPLLRGNPYLEAIAMVELLDRHAVVSGIDALLRRPEQRADLLQRQARYVAGLVGLPGPAELVLAAIT